MGNIKERIRNSRLLSISALGWLILAGVFMITLYYMGNYFIYTVDSDMSSELLLGKLLAEENSIITNRWYYSTVLKVIDTNLLWALLFEIFDSWHIVRLTGSFIIYLLTLACLYFFCWQAGLKKYFGFIGALVLLPISKDYFYIAVRGLFYTATMLTALLTLGMWFLFIRCRNLKGRIFVAAAAALVSLVGGLCGPMQLVMFNVPMLLAAVLYCMLEHNEDKKALIAGFPLLMAASTVAGYIFSSGVLAGLYQFQSYDQLLFTAFSMNNFSSVINSLINIFGYRTDESVFSSALLFNFMAGIWLLLGLTSSIYTLKSNTHSRFSKLTASLYIAYLATMFMVFSLSSQTLLTRYMVLAVIFAALSIFSCFGTNYKNRKPGQLVLASFMALALLCGALSYNEMRKVDDTKGQREAVQAILDAGYTQGYATFWNANVLTELSNGRLELWHWSDGKQNISNLEDFNDIYAWLQLKSHVEAPPEGKVFVLLSANEDYYFEFTKKFSQDDVIYRAENYLDYGVKDYIVYGFESYEELASRLEG